MAPSIFPMVYQLAFTVLRISAVETSATLLNLMKALIRLEMVLLDAGLRKPKLMD